MCDRHLRNALRDASTDPTQENLARVGTLYQRSLAPVTGPVEPCPDCSARAGQTHPETEYWSDVRDMSASLISELRDEGLDRESWMDRIHESIDGSRRVFVTALAIECLRYSPNDGTYQDEFGEMPDGSSGLPWSILAFSAFHRDVLDHIESEGVDVNAPWGCPTCSDTHDSLNDAMECCEGVCSDCDEWVVTKDQIRHSKDRDAWIHRNCPARVETQSRGRTR